MKKTPENGLVSGKIALVLRGFFMGLADVIPGVSGGTIAYITGIYPQLIAALATFNHMWFANLFSFKLVRLKAALGAVPYGFILPLLLGVLVAITVFVWIIPLGVLVEAHPLIFKSLFFGLVGVSALFLLFRYGSLCPRLMLFAYGGFILAYAGTGMVAVQGLHTPWFTFLSGMLAICAMLLPGISGALMLIILGQYSHILNGLKDFDFAIILPFIGGIGVGLLLFAHGLNWLITHHYRKTMLVMVGLLFGSLRALWPFAHTPSTPSSIWSFALFAALGAGVAVVIFKWKKASNKPS